MAKPNLLKKVVRSQVVGGAPASPAVPPYCISTYQPLPVDSDRKILFSGNGQTITLVYIDAAGFAVNQKYPVKLSQQRTQYVLVQQCFPGKPMVPAVPGKTVSVPDNGWNGGARSKRAIEGDGSFTVTVPAGVFGVVVGLSDGRPVRSLNHIAFGFLFQRGLTVSVVEAGEVVFDTGELSSEQHTVKVQCSGGRIGYFIDGQQVFESSKTPFSPMYGEAVLRTAADYVFAPSIEVVSGGGADLRLPAMLATAGDYELAQLVGRIPVPRLNARMRATVAASLRVPAPTLFASDKPYSAGGGRIPASTLDAGGTDGELVLQSGGGRIPLPASTGLLLVGSVGGLDAVMPGIKGLSADRPYAAGGGSWPSRYICGAWERADSDSHLIPVDRLYLLDSMIADVPLVIVVTDGLEVSSSAQIVVVANEQVIDAIALQDALSLVGEMAISVSDRVRYDDAVYSARRAAVSYAVDILTGALSEYEGYDFSHFALAGGELWAAKKDGIYRLGTSPVERAILDLGTMDFGTSQQKRMNMAHVGLRTDGEVYLRFSTDGIDRVYRIMTRGDIGRAVLAKGVSARQWNVQLELVDATYATVDSMEFEVGASQRRLGFRR
jgi:hypothetical protein